MEAKLTLKLDKNVILRAKKYAVNREVSLSYLIETYLDVITRDSEEKDDIEISPFVKSISTGKSIPADFDWKTAREEHINHLEEKYR